MINLIPNILRKKIIFEYWIRVASVWLVTLSIAGMVSSLLFLPTYVLISSQVATYEGSTKAVAEKANNYDSAVQSLELANTQAERLYELRSQERFSGTLTLLESLQGSDIQITSYEFRRKGNVLDKINVVGKAKTRQALADFRDLLLKHPDIEEVVLPISNLAKDRDIVFNIVLTPKVIAKKESAS
jgi:hypothetical protein